jgi:diguanylate cyclase (GGDEF)-like protein
MQAGASEASEVTERMEPEVPWPALAPELLKRLLDALPTGVALQGADARVLWANRALSHQIGLAAAAMVGRVLEGEYLERVEREDGEALYHVPRGGEGRAEWLRVSTVRLSEHPVSGHRVALFEDVTQTERFRRQVDRLQQALHGQVSTDEATGLLNRRGVLHQLEAQVSRSRRYNNVLSVVVMRVRCQGAAAGAGSPQSLVSVARMLRDQTRWPDIIGRWGDQDFVLVLPETSEAAAGSLTAKLRPRLAELLPGGDATACVADFGVAQWQKNDTAQALLERAARGLP